MAEGAKLVPLFIRIMIQRSKDCHNEVIISSVQWIIKRPLKENTCIITVYSFYGYCITCIIKLPPSAINIVFPDLAPTCIRPLGF